MGGITTRLRVGVAFASILLLCGLRAAEQVPAAAAGRGHRRQARAAQGHALHGGDRLDGAAQSRRSRRPRAGLPRQGRLQGRRRRQEGRSAVPDRQGGLQDRPADRRGDAAAAGSAAHPGGRRPEAQAGSGEDVGGVGRPGRRIRAPSAIRRMAALAQAKGQVEQAKRNLAYTTITAPFDGTMSARLVDPGAMVGAGEPDQARHDRAARSDLREVQHRRAAGADRSASACARRRDAEGPRADPGRHRAADRAGLSAYRHARLRGAGDRFQHRHARRPRHPRQQGRACCSRACSCACASPSRWTSSRCWCPTSRSATTSRAATCWSSTTRTSSSSARSRSASWSMGRCASSTAASSPTSASSSAASCARCPATPSCRSRRPRRPGKSGGQ